MLLHFVSTDIFPFAVVGCCHLQDSRALAGYEARPWESTTFAIARRHRTAQPHSPGEAGEVDGGQQIKGMDNWREGGEVADQYLQDSNPWSLALLCLIRSEPSRRPKPTASVQEFVGEFEDRGGPL